jgi:Protein of unknown function (DUF3048) N-terminal domain/Protein of unknown function (DUF3048) C-terminal domain
MPVPFRSTLAVVAAALALAACGGGGGDDDAAPTTTLASTTSSSSSTSTTSTTVKRTTTTASTTTTTIAVAVNPLTGAAVAEPLVAFRPALAVKIDNHPEARPQVGLNQADIVVEEIVEGITRFFVVFHSQGTDPVGPIRSARTTDVDLLGAFSTPLFAWSGGNAGVTRAIAEADATNVGANVAYQAGGYFRQPGRRAPHDLFASSSALWSLAPEGQGQPDPVFAYRVLGAEPGGGEPVQGVRMGLEGTRVQWLWDAASASYVREQNGTPHTTDPDEAQVSAQNVVILTTEYGRSAADSRSPEAITVGSGEARVLQDGVLVRGTWERADAADGWTLKAADGSPILLAPGRTWIELARAGDVAEIPDGADPAGFPFP